MLACAAQAQDTAPTGNTAEGDAEEDVVVLSAFTVSTERDYGYRASNTISGTRSNTPIKDIPLNIQVFTKDLADDLIITNQVDLEAYNASLVNGGADMRSNNPIQQAYNAFLFRGFVQNWGLRDGIREYDPIDAQGLARVEVVKGPAGALYGLSYPGGIMNNITKDVDYSSDFAVARLTLENEGGYRAAVDANFAGEVSGGKYGVRVNAAHTSTEDSRAHSRGQINYTQLNLNWQPTHMTEFKFLAEEGYREKPNGLNYFTRAAPGNASIPLQIDHPEIPWEWNWANRYNMRSLDTDLYRGTWNQKFGENFQTTAYVQFSRRKQIDGDGWDANGSGGADSWEAGGGWINAGGPNDFIEAGYSYRDWSNDMHAYGATGVYKFDVGGMRNTFTFGGASWAENFVSRSSTQQPNPGDAPIHLVFPIQAGIPIEVPPAPPADLRPQVTGNGWTRENNSNENYFVSWQASMFENRLKTNLGINHTKLKLIQWANGTSPAPTNQTRETQNSPMIGAMFDITDEISIFGVHAESLFPTTDKNSFGTQMPPVTGENLEFGFKVALLEGKLNGTISYYNIEQEGGSQNDPTSENLNTSRWDSMNAEQRAAAFPGVTNRSELLGDLVPGAVQESKGIEIDLNYQPTRSWVINLSFANNDQEITDAINVANIGQSNPGQVKTRWALLTKYTFDDGGPMKGLFVGTGITYTGKAIVDYQGGVARYNPATTGIELFGGYRFRTFEYDSMLQLNIKNLSRVDEFVGWQPNGGALATQRYRVSTPVVYALTYEIRL